MQKAKVLNKVIDIISIILTVLILPWLFLAALIAVLFTNGSSQDQNHVNFIDLFVFNTQIFIFNVCNK